MESQNETKTEWQTFQKPGDEGNEFSLLYGRPSGPGKISIYRAQFGKL